MLLPLGVTIKYKYAYSNNVNPTNWNDTWLTLAELQAIPDITCKFLSIDIQLTSSAGESCTVGDGSIAYTDPIYIPYRIKVSNASFTVAEVAEQRLDGTRATELSLKEGVTSSSIICSSMDSGIVGSTWDMSTFNMFENPNSEEGTITYKYAYGDSTDPTNWNGVWLTKAQLQAVADKVGRYLRIQVLLDGGVTPVGCTIGEGSIYCTTTISFKEVQLIKGI